MTGLAIREIPVDPAFFGAPPLALTEDGSLLAVGDTMPGKMFDVWEVSSGRLRFRRAAAFLEPISGGAAGLAFSQDGHYLAMLNSSGTAEIWSTTDWRIVDRVSGFTSRGELDFKDGRQLFVYNSDGTAQTWTRGAVAVNAAPGRKSTPAEFPLPDGVASQGDSFSADFEITADDRLLLPGHPNRVFDLRSGTLRQLPSFGSYETLAESYSVANPAWIGAADYAHCYFIDPKTLNVAAERTRNCNGKIALSKDGKRAAFGRNTKVAVFNTQDNSEKEYDLGYNIESLSFSADGSVVLVTAGASGIHGVAADTGEPVPIPAGGTISGDLQYALQTGSFVRMVDAKSGRGLYELPLNVNAGSSFSADGRYVAMPLNSGAIAVIEIATQRRVAVLSGFTGTLIHRIRFTSDNKCVIASGLNGFIRIWDLGRQSEMMTLSLQEMNWAAFTPAGYFDGSAGELANYYWVRGAEIVPLASAATDRRVPGLAASVWGGRSPPGDGSTSSSLSPIDLPIPEVTPTPDASGSNAPSANISVRLRDAQPGAVTVFATRNGVPVRVLRREGEANLWVAQIPLVAGGNRIAVWAQDSLGRDSSEVVLTRSFREPTPRPEIVTQVSQEQFQRIAFSNDGSLMATAAGHVITLWDTRSRRQLRTILDHSEAVSGLEFGPDAGTLVSAAGDSTVRVWSTRTGAEKCRITALATSDAPSITLSPDGERIAVGESSPDLIRIVRTADCIEESSIDSGPAEPAWAARRTLLIQSKNERNLLLSVDLERNSETPARVAGEFRTIATLSDGRVAILLSDGSLQARPPDGAFESLHLPMQPAGKIQRIAAMRSGRLLVDTGKTQMLLSPGLNAIERTWNAGFLAAAAVSADESWIGFIDTLGTLSIYDGKSPSKVDFPIPESFGAVTQLRFSKSGDVLVSGYGSMVLFGDMFVTAPGSARLSFWDLATSSVIHTLAPRLQPGQIEPSANWFLTSGLTRIGFANNQLSSAPLQFKTERSQNGELRVEDLHADKDQTTVTLPTPEMATSLMLHGWRLSSSGTIAVMAGRRNGELRMADLATEKDISRFRAHPATLSEAAVSDDGAFVLTCGDGADGNSVRLWKSDGTPVWAKEGESPNPHLLAFSQDNKFVAVAADGAIRVLDATSGSPVKTFEMEPAGATAVAFSPDGRRLAVGTADGLIHLYDFASGQRVVTLVARSDGSLAYTPDAYYSGTLARSLALSFRIGNRVYPLRQFDLSFNRPDILMSRTAPELPAVARAYRTAYERRLKEAGVGADALQSGNELPELRVSAAGNGSTEKRDIALAITANARGGIPLSYIEVRVNGVPEPLVGAKGRDTLNITIPAVLSSGSNNIEVTAVDARQRRSLTEQFSVTCNARSTRTLYLAAVGISAYADKNMMLEFAAKDARDLAKFFNERSTGAQSSLPAPNAAFDRVVIADPLTDAGATQENILKLREFFARADVDDVAVLFFAGHGLLDSKLDFYFAPYDMEFANAALRGISITAMERILSSSRSRRRLLLVDACHSGEVDKDGSVIRATSAKTAAQVSPLSNVPGNRRGVKAAPLEMGETNAFELERSLFLDLRENTGTEIIAASRGAESAYEYENLANGLFTRSILDGLADAAADENGDGHVSLSELMDFVTDRVRHMSHGRQTPTRRQENLDQNYLLE